jgi:hypothetical protein
MQTPELQENCLKLHPHIPSSLGRIGRSSTPPRNKLAYKPADKLIRLHSKVWLSVVEVLSFDGDLSKEQVEEQEGERGVRGGTARWRTLAHPMSICRILYA